MNSSNDRDRGDHPLREQYGNKETVKRIGCWLAQPGVSDDRLSKMKRHLGFAKSLIPWITDQAAKGSVNWRPDDGFGSDISSASTMPNMSARSETLNFSG